MFLGSQLLLSNKSAWIFFQIIYLSKYIKFKVYTKLQQLNINRINNLLKHCVINFLIQCYTGKQFSLIRILPKTYNNNIISPELENSSVL